MKTILGIIFLFPSFAFAGAYSKEGKVVDILFRTGSSNHAIFYVSGFASAGACLTYRDLVAISVPDDEKKDARLSLLLAASMAEKTIHITLDDNKRETNGVCIVQDLRLSKSF